MLTPKVGPA